jgi:hypothetical protein
MGWFRVADSWRPGAHLLQRRDGATAGLARRARTRQAIFVGPTCRVPPVREEKGEGRERLPLRLAGPRAGRRPTRGKRRREERRWAAPAGQKGRRMKDEPETFLHLWNAFLFLFPGFHTKLLERKFK